jgi:hypothetical protein
LLSITGRDLLDSARLDIPLVPGGNIRRQGKSSPCPATRQTASLMTALCGRLRDQPGPDARQAARWEMIRAHQAPLFWTLFILTGE